jgi:hypothetical protein
MSGKEREKAMKVVEFKNGETVSIREAVKEDASRIIYAW